MELDKYYLTSDGMIAIVRQEEDAECPILGYGSIGSCGSLLWIGFDYDTKPAFEIDKEVRLIEELQACGTSEEIESVLTLIRAKAKRLGINIKE